MSDETNGRGKPRFDPTINYGHILTAATFIAAGLAAFLGMNVELQDLNQRVARVETTLQQLANIVVVSARQDERLKAIERRVDRLEEFSAQRHE
ncbi:MAG: hypothetical protein P8Y71_22550 [Pseudolabrys sp.]